MDCGDGCSLDVVDSVLDLADGFESVGDFECKFAAIGMAGLNLWQTALLTFGRSEVWKIDAGFQACYVTVRFGNGVFPDGKRW